MRQTAALILTLIAGSAGVLLARATTLPASGPATSPAIGAGAAPLVEQLRNLVPKEHAGLRQVGQALKHHELETGPMWEIKANYVIRDRSKGIAAILEGRTGTVAIFDYLAKAAAGTERPWVPRSKGMVLFPYLESKLEMTEEKVGTRPARMLSADDWGARRLIVRGNDRFDVVFTLRPGDDGAAVPLEDLSRAAEQFDWVKLDALQDVPPAYLQPEVAPPRR